MLSEHTEFSKYLQRLFRLGGLSKIYINQTVLTNGSFVDDFRAKEAVHKVGSLSFPPRQPEVRVTAARFALPRSLLRASQEDALD